MRHLFIVVALAGFGLPGVADAAPGFGASSHRLGGGATSSTKAETETVSVFEALVKFIRGDASVSVTPVVDETYSNGKAKAEKCDNPDKREVAKADAKDDESDASKGKTPMGEPVYLAF